MSAAIACRYVRRMAEIETRGFGDDDNALRRLEAKFGLSYWTLRYLKLGRSTKIICAAVKRWLKDEGHTPLPVQRGKR